MCDMPTISVECAVLSIIQAMCQILQHWLSRDTQHPMDVKLESLAELFDLCHKLEFVLDLMLYMCCTDCVPNEPRPSTTKGTDGQQKRGREGDPR